MKRYKVKVVFMTTDTVEVEAEDEKEAEEKAIGEARVNPDLSDVYDVTIKEIGEVLK
jgi:hypothetical protein